MLDSFKRLFKGEPDREASGVSPEEAAAALLVETASADGVYETLEGDLILDLLGQSFDLDRSEAEATLRRGEALARDAVGAQRFTREIKVLGEAARLNMIEGLYRVSTADGDRCAFEDAFVRHVASLLHVDDVARAQARQRADQLRKAS